MVIYEIQPCPPIAKHLGAFPASVGSCFPFPDADTGSEALNHPSAAAAMEAVVGEEAAGPEECDAALKDLEQ